nr:MAG TPA: hypothetical protein [Caudoviricetes sp.]
MAKRDVLNSLEYRRIKDTYNGVLFADNSGDKLNKSPIIYNGDGVIMPFSFSTNAINLSGNQITCDKILTHDGVDTTNITNITANKIYTKNCSSVSDQNITKQNEDTFIAKSIIPNKIVKPEFKSYYSEVVDIFNETQSDFEPLICNHKDSGSRNQINFNILNPEHYTVIIATVIVHIYENRGDIKLLINGAVVQSKYVEIAVSRGDQGGGYVPITFIYTCSPNTLPLGDNILKVEHTGFITSYNITDILILHGPSI